MARDGKSIRKAGDLCIVDLITNGGEAAGAVAWHLSSGAPVTIAAKATVLATGGLTRFFAATAPRSTWAATAMRWRCAPARR